MKLRLRNPLDLAYKIVATKRVLVIITQFIDKHWEREIITYLFPMKASRIIQKILRELIYKILDRRN